MCGIAGIHFKKPGAINGPQLERFVDRLLLGIEHRGGDATGVVSVAPGGTRVVMDKQALTAADFIKGRQSLGDGEIRTVLLHTRFATQGHQSDNANNHPVLHGTTFVTHNGHISNDDALFRDEEIQRIAEVDSEIIAAMIDKKGFDKVHLALQSLSGGFAIAAINPIANPDQLILAKGPNSPLVYFENDRFIVWASVIDAIKEAWGDTLGTPPRDYKFKQLNAGGILMFDGANSEELMFEVKKLPAYTGGGYSSYAGNGRGWNTAGITQMEKDDTCFCGHRRFWHGGRDYTDSCMSRTDMPENKYCDCKSFLSMEGAAAGSVRMKCDGCATWADEVDIVVFTADYALCEECNDEFGRYFEVAYPPNEESEEAVEGEVVAEEDVSCEVQAGQIVTPLRVIDGGKRPALMSGDDQVRHEFILGKVEAETGYNKEFVEWVLFRSEIDIVNADAWLKAAHEECDEMYGSLEAELNGIAEDIGSKEMVKREILH